MINYKYGYCNKCEKSCNDKVHKPLRPKGNNSRKTRNQNVISILRFAYICLQTVWPIPIDSQTLCGGYKTLYIVSSLCP